MILWALVILVPLVAVCWILGRFDRADVEDDWENLLSRANSEYLDYWEQQVRLEPELAALTYDSAKEALDREEVEEARRLLAISYRTFCGATPDRLKRLRGMAVCSRMAAAFVPILPVRPSDFALREVSAVAGVGQVLHHLLVTGAERFVLRVRIIGFGFRLALRAMNRSKDGETIEAWERFGAGTADWRALDDAHIASLRALLQSVRAQRRERALVLFH